MKTQLSVSEVGALISKAEESIRHEECATCECYLGYITQLELDSDLEGQQYIKDSYPEMNKPHSCLGCDPCPPGILFSNYLRSKSKQTR